MTQSNSWSVRSARRTTMRKNSAHTGFVLCGGLDEPQQLLFARPQDAQCEQHAILREGLAIEEEHDHLVLLQAALAQLSPAGRWPK